MCERRVKDFDTGDYVYQTGEGFFDVFKNIGSKLVEKGAKVAANKSAQKLGKIAAEKIGQKGSEMIIDKIAPSTVKRIENKLENKGDLIIKELQKMQPKENKTSETKRSSINEDFDKIINM